MDAHSDTDSSVELVECHSIDHEGSRSMEEDESTSPNRSSSLSSSSNSSSTSSSEGVVGTGRSAHDRSILLYRESPNVSAMIVALNATNALNTVFSNNGQDLSDDAGPVDLNYDPEWYWKMPSVPERKEYNEDSWRMSLRKELQLLNAYLSTDLFKRRSAYTGELESLFRMKVPATEERQFDIGTIFTILVGIPEIHSKIFQYVTIDSERVPVLPIPVEVDGFEGSLQDALDRVFWTQLLDKSIPLEEDSTQVPILDDLCDVIMVQCQQMQIEIEEHLWPERYTDAYRDQVVAKWQERKDVEDKIEQLAKTHREKASFKGKSVADTLSTAVTSLASAGLERAANEISDHLSTLKIELQELETEREKVKASAKPLESGQSIVPIDPSTMTRYTLKAIVRTEFVGDQPTVMTRVSDNSSDWNYFQDTESYVLTWRNIVDLARKSENYLLIYERDVDTTQRVAPSIREFAAKDNETLLPPPPPPSSTQPGATTVIDDQLI